MRVYILFGNTPEGKEVFGVFDQEEKAEEEKVNYHGVDDWSIESYLVD